MPPATFHQRPFPTAPYRLILVALLLLLAAACQPASGQKPRVAEQPPLEDQRQTRRPAKSIPIKKVTVEDHNTYLVPEPNFTRLGGDLWPQTWADDGDVYAANGDGYGFGRYPGDMKVNRLVGEPPNLHGEAIVGAIAKHLGEIWPGYESEYNRKPTGMICVDGVLYLFYQNLRKFREKGEFCGAPVASISWSRDHGKTWQWNGSGPMFTDHQFTTGFFLDYGRNNRDAKDEYVYVYGLDFNWRGCEDYKSDKLYLARVPRNAIADRRMWQFFVERNADGGARWSRELRDKKPVLLDETTYGEKFSGVAQGSVTYIPALDRYLYATWSWSAWIFWEAPAPWGPWTRVGVHGWGREKWNANYHGGYATVVPSKFLRRDGTGGWIVSSLNTIFDNKYYRYAMRRFFIEAGE